MDGTRQREGGTKQGPWGPRGHPALLGRHISVWEAGPGLDAGEEQGASHRPSAPPRPVPSSSQLSAPRGGAVRTIPFSLSPLAPVRFEQQYPQWGLQGGSRPCQSQVIPLPRWAVAPPPGCSCSSPSTISALRAQLPASPWPHGHVMGLGMESSQHPKHRERDLDGAPSQHECLTHSNWV